MTTTDGLPESVQPFLHPGERLEHAIPGQSLNGNLLGAAMVAGFAIFAVAGGVLGESLSAQVSSSFAKSLLPLLGAAFGVVLGGGLVSRALLARNRYRIIAVTADRILLLDAGRLRSPRARDVLAVHRRSLRLGPVSGLWHRVGIPQHPVHVHRSFFPNIDAADSAAGDRSQAAR